MGCFAFVSLGWLILAISLSGAGAQISCPFDWYPHSNFCYKVFNEHVDWNTAEMFCVNHKPGCHLASIHGRTQSADLAEYVSQYLRSGGNVWTGLRDPSKKRTWQWTDRSLIDYTAWNEGEPNNRQNNEYCVELWSGSGYQKWNDENCGSLRAFLCKCKF